MSSDYSSSDSPSAAVDASLLEAITRGNKAAMASFYTRHAKRVYAVALRVLRDPTAAEDVLQEIFMQIWRSPTTFVATRGSLEGWLAVMARNRAIDVIRRRRRCERIDELFLPSSQQLAAEVERNIYLECIKRAVADLPHSQRRVLELAFFDGLTHVEIARKTGDPLGTVKTRIRQALHRLGKEFSDTSRSQQ